MRWLLTEAGHEAKEGDQDYQYARADDSLHDRALAEVQYPIQCQRRAADGYADEEKNNPYRARC